jgi:large subunit ribosomal protein L1
MAKKPAEPVTDTPPATPAPEAAPVAAPEQATAKKKTIPTETGKKKSQPGIPPHRGKKLANHLKNQQSKLNKEGAVPVKRAISLLKSMKRAKFDETVEVHMHLGIDPAQNDQNVRGSVSLPYGVGKTVRVIVFCQADDVAKAKEAGADMVGADEVIKKVQDGWTDFDVALATQSMMGQVSRLGKVLGPRGLMPTPKAGTVIPAGGDVGKAVQEFKAGKVEYRSDKGGNVHAGVGKLSFDEEKLVTNIQAFVDQVRASKPSGVKGHFIHSVTVSATMSPGIAVSA